MTLPNFKEYEGDNVPVPLLGDLEIDMGKVFRE